ncbi:EscE/YscE/SsaE family type III secretion system needle protein co-chaperone [Thiothrix fructosivorans]|jgi:flagellar biosynthesis chaperone FliJ|uniref:EscE/YscE/SsaE family type III secretion system needle protein co-chaperone n=1 Tax=Thiothrix fructosivorans TaxID=111770 RepID=A0A8B0SGN1_9GAMM|nr:EscE/YscE/SsaE family type III secretion system needle protein co-chaperone [Thiothrix fructosivorans]MBO0614427.1 EscE/YscE/SsaE family type III secretion system needle protein co-chaperone [Thiothrix fructosivorans]QTX09268.1 EscE/YscE/SsaE family type III secretion system needle protein co-chaperone [Thiothrix fructosivorans]
MMLQIEQNLRNDVSGMYKNELLDKFNQAASEVRSELNQGVSPDEYDKLNRFLQALDASCEVVEEFWSQTHQ